MSDLSAQTIAANCGYCSEIFDDDNYLLCQQCSQNVHIKCLRHASTPGDLCGDVFFDFTCAHCMQNEPGTSRELQREKFERQRLSWLMIITLTLYNLSIKSKGLSYQGYFHWRSHITSFIDKNWHYLFPAGVRRPKQWIGSITGALSHNSPDFFQSGQEFIYESGWWKLTHANHSPRQIFQLAEEKRQQRIEKRALEQSSNNSATNDLIADFYEAKRLRRLNVLETEEEPAVVESCARCLKYMGCQPRITKQLNIIDDEKQQQQPFNSVQSNLMDFLAENLCTDDLSMFSNSLAQDSLVSAGKTDLLPLIDAQADAGNFFDVPEFEAQLVDKWSSYEAQRGNSKGKAMFEQYDNSLQSNDNNQSSQSDVSAASSDDSLDSDEFKPRIVQVTNFQDMEESQSMKQCIKVESKSDMEHSDQEEQPNVCDDALPSCEPSLFKKRQQRIWPWLLQRNDAIDEQQHESTTNGKLGMMSEYEERQLLQKLHRVFAFEKECQIEIPAHVRRFYRKLCVREWKRDHNKPIFNLDEFLDTKKRFKYAHLHQKNVLDRYQLISLAIHNERTTFHARIYGGEPVYEMFESPYSKRMLHPFIFKSTECFPPWMKLMLELQYKVNGELPTRAPIDYCYVRPNHIPAVNALLQSEFWPGIDMTECLSYPDYSVVVLYKKLVIGCAFLVPDVGYNEAYISFMAVRSGWRCSGIGHFMLYHLIQTSWTKDITLHVSASNPAIFLYQKFGFKMQEIIINFYEKYLPFDSRHSRNALFLKLLRT